MINAPSAPPKILAQSTDRTTNPEWGCSTKPRPHRSDRRRRWAGWR